MADLPVAASRSRIVCMAAAVHSCRKSLPEKPSVFSASLLMLTSLAKSCPVRITCKWKVLSVASHAVAQAAQALGKIAGQLATESQGCRQGALEDALL